SRRSKLAGRAPNNSGTPCTAVDGDGPWPLRLLPARHARPRGRDAAEKRDELAALHSITSSACASKVGAVSADGIACGRRQDYAGLQHIDLASVSQRVREPDSRCALHPCDLNLPEG